MGSTTAKIGKSRKTRFLQAFARTGVLLRAAKIAGCSLGSHYLWLKDPKYAARFEQAEEEAIQRLEEEALRRAVKGSKDPIFYQGQQCGSVTRYSDTLLIFMLKARRPDVYRERYDIKGQAGAIGGTVRVIHQYLDSPAADSSALALPPASLDAEVLAAALPGNEQGSEPDAGEQREHEPVSAVRVKARVASRRRSKARKPRKHKRQAPIGRVAVMPDTREQAPAIHQGDSEDGSHGGDSRVTGSAAPSVLEPEAPEPGSEPGE